MSKGQTDRLSKQHEQSGGPKGIFGKNAQKHEVSVTEASKKVFDELKKAYPQLNFRYRTKIPKKEINDELNKIDSRLGKALYVKNAKIRPDGGIIEVEDDKGKWRIILVVEAKHQGKDVENIQAGKKVGKNKDQDLMVAGNAIERVHKNINEIRNMMLKE
ncbi:restriction endonuclease, partial [Candidatus Woesearchaeota archaeon]|nr:restriction endonuclease [Candidatus Woesearchaeota archaeon]